MRLLLILANIFILCSCVNSGNVGLKRTQVSIPIKTIAMGVLKANVAKDTTFVIENTGDEPLILMNVETSCGCTSSQWTQQPIKPNMSGEVKVIYDAKYPGYFYKTITIYANIEPSPLELHITGEVELIEQDL